MRGSFVFATAILLASAFAGDETHNKPPEAQFVSVNGVRLHYLDWGGRRTALLFLAALGATIVSTSSA